MSRLWVLLIESSTETHTEAHQTSQWRWRLHLVVQPGRPICTAVVLNRVEHCNNIHMLIVSCAGEWNVGTILILALKRGGIQKQISATHFVHSE